MDKTGDFADLGGAGGRRGRREEFLEDVRVLPSPYSCRTLVFRQGQHFLDFRQRVPGAEAPHPLALKGPQPALTPGDDVAALFAASSAQVFGAFVSLALDEPEAQPPAR